MRAPKKAQAHRSPFHRQFGLPVAPLARLHMAEGGIFGHPRFSPPIFPTRRGSYFDHALEVERATCVTTGSINIAVGEESSPIIIGARSIDRLGHLTIQPPPCESKAPSSSPPPSPARPRPPTPPTARSRGGVTAPSTAPASRPPRARKTAPPRPPEETSRPRRRRAGRPRRTAGRGGTRRSTAGGRGVRRRETGGRAARRARAGGRARPSRAGGRAASRRGRWARYVCSY